MRLIGKGNGALVSGCQLPVTGYQLPIPGSWFNYGGGVVLETGNRQLVTGKG